MTLSQVDGWTHSLFLSNLKFSTLRKGYIGYNGHLVACADLKSHHYTVSFLLGYTFIEPKNKKEKE